MTTNSKKIVATFRILPKVCPDYIQDAPVKTLVDRVQVLSDWLQLSFMSARNEGKGIEDLLADFNKPGGMAVLLYGKKN